MEDEKIVKKIFELTSEAELGLDDLDIGFV
jgi:hypothetical protein